MTRTEYESYDVAKARAVESGLPLLIQFKAPG